MKLSAALLWTEKLLLPNSVGSRADTSLYKVIMKKFIIMAAAALLTVGAASCSKTVNMEPVALEEMDPNECYFDGTDKLAPAWTCGFPVEGYEVTGVGVMRPTKAGSSFARQQAAMDARVNIATEMQAKVGAMVKNYAATTGVADAETVDAVSSNTQRQITAEMLYGAKVLRFTKSPNGSTYALVTLDATMAAAAAKEAMMTSYKNDNAQWQRFLGEKSQAELEREMDKMVHNEFQAFNAEMSQ
jgi:hypothetical protein